MKQALKLAERGRGYTRSNPLVGAVILTAAGTLAGEGFHSQQGSAHAEIEALAAAGERARGGTMIVNLEPCCHTGRTGPCTEAIIQAGIARVVIAHRDPDPRVEGRGVARLRTAGIEVIESVEMAAARSTNEHYLKFKTLGRPFVTLKLALSLDGMTADAEGHSQWLTGPECRKHAHLLRSRHDAIVVGAGTARADNPELTVRHVSGAQPQRFVLAGHGPLDRALKLFAGSRPAIRVGAEGTDADWRVPSDARGYPDIAHFLQELGRQEYTSLLVEGGSRLAAAVIATELVDRLVLYYGPLLLGRGRSAFEGWETALASAPRLERVSVQPLADGIVITGAPIWSEDVHRTG
jgi:diaminohydroxyphosphoribosylaminopyrimidine deaminase/5-amino-6-(5-phosphoribosylamino)uracil reductase